MTLNFRKKQSVLFYCNFKVDTHYFMKINIRYIVSLAFLKVITFYKARSRYNLIFIFSAHTSGPNWTVTPKTETKNGEDLRC